MFLQGFWVFFPGLKPKAKISKNIDFIKEKLIFSRVRRFKIDQKSKKNSKLEVKIRFWRPKINHNVDFGGQEAILEAKITILETKNAILGVPKGFSNHHPRSNEFISICIRFVAFFHVPPKIADMRFVSYFTMRNTCWPFLALHV